MMEFLKAMLFGSIEYFAVVLFTLSLFKFRIELYKVEMLVTAVVLNLLSYISIKNDIAIYFSILQLVVMPIIYKYFFYGRKWLYSIGISCAGYILYFFIQIIVAQICVYTGFQTLEELNTPFTVKGEILQILCAVIAITISIYLRIFKEGYGFNIVSFQKGKSFLFVTVIGMIIVAGCFYSFTRSVSFASYIIITIALITSSLLVLYISHKREELELNI